MTPLRASPGAPSARRVLACVAAAIFCVAASASGQTHPRVWLSPDALFSAKTKAAARDRDWLTLKASADKLLSQSMPRYTVTGATNSNPVGLTITERVPWPDTVNVFVSGATGPWAAVNSPGADHPRSVIATRTGEHTFTLPIDSTRLGAFSGQKVVLFFPEGGYSAYGYQGLDWQAQIQTLAIAYQVTGNAAYAAKGLELFDYICSLGAAGMLAPEAIDSGFPSRSTVVAVALGYDWFYDRLSSPQKSAAIQSVNLWYDWFRRAAFENNGPAYGNYFGGHVLGFGLAGYAMEDDNPRGTEIASTVRGLFDSQVHEAFESGGFAGGFPVEAYTYGANHFVRLLYYMLAIRSSTGENIFASTDYAQKLARNLIYNLKPNRWQVSDEGDYAGDFTGVMQPTLPLVLAHVLAGTREGGWMQFLSQHLARSPHGGQTEDPLERFLFFDPARPAADYRRELPAWFLSPGDDHAYWRSSWDDDAVWASMMGGARIWASHQMRAAGHVALQRGNDYLLVNAGQWKGQNGVTGNPQVFDTRAWRANTLFVDDGGDYLFTGREYVGGQGFWGSNAVLAREGVGGLVYMKADLTSAYSLGDRKPENDRSVRVFQRSFVALGSGLVVLFDRAEFRKPTYTRKLYFHVNPAGGPPKVAGNVVTTRVGTSALFIKTLLPAQPLIAVAGDAVTDADPRAATYRVEVSDSDPGTSFTALNVIQATAASGTAREATRVTSMSGNMAGTAIVDGSVSRIVLFALDGTAQSGVSYEVQMPQAGSHVLVDMKPDTAFDVMLNGSVIGHLTSSRAGLVMFPSAGGGRFELRSSRPPAAARSAVEDHPGDATRRPDVRQETVSAIEAAKRAQNRPLHPAVAGARSVAMVLPVDGETVTAPGKLRLVASAHDPSVFNNFPTDGHGGNASRVEFFVDDRAVLVVPGSDGEFWVFKGMAGDVPAGVHRVWARATFTNPALILDSDTIFVTIREAPVYSKTIELTADLRISPRYELGDSSGGRVRVNGNGHRIVSEAGRASTVLLRGVDFFDLGDRADASQPGMALDVTNLSIEDCSFEDSNRLLITLTGDAAAVLRRNTFHSNMRQPLGQYPDGNGGPEHGSFPVLTIDGGAGSNDRFFRGNNVAAGWVQFVSTRGWTIGGEAKEDANVLIGARVGIQIDRSSEMRVVGNYSHHTYYGGWSQASNLELGGASTTVAENNVIIGSSWPVRGVGGEFRFNVVLEGGHEWLWADHDNADIHHNLFAGGENDVGGILVLYQPRNVLLSNNTFDLRNSTLAAGAITLNDGVAHLSANLFLNAPKTAISSGHATLAADYNGFWKSTAPHYSDGRTPPHDVDWDPGIDTSSRLLDFDEWRLWLRVLDTKDVIEEYRAKYSPRKPVIRSDATPIDAPEYIGAVAPSTHGDSDPIGR